LGIYKSFNPIIKGARIINKNSSSLLSEFITGNNGNLRFDFPIPVIKRGKGPYLYDYDGNRYVDFYLCEGNLLLGHTPPQVTRIVKSWLNRCHSGGYPTTTQQMLTRKICSTFLKQNSSSLYENTFWFYFDSPFEAASKLLLLLLEYTGMKNGVYISTENNQIRSFSPFKALPLQWLHLDQVEETSFKGLDFIIFEANPSTDLKRIADLCFISRKRRLLVISDETESFSFFSYYMNRDTFKNIDVRVFGRWIASGLSFGCAAIDKNVFKEIDILNRFRKAPHLYTLMGFPPLYKIKAIVRFLDEMEKLGGLESLRNKFLKFYKMLDKRFFELIYGIIFMKEPELLSHEWHVWHEKLLEKNFLFPPSPFYPLNISLSHFDELLEKSAEEINSVFSSNY